MPAADRFGRGIERDRTLSPRDMGRVRAHFMWWANTHRLPSPQPPPNFDEVRWSNDFRYVYVSKLSGLDRVLQPATPVNEGHAWAIYDRTSDAAAKLLDVIHEVVGEEP